MGKGMLLMMMAMWSYGWKWWRPPCLKLQFWNTSWLCFGITGIFIRISRSFLKAKSLNLIVRYNAMKLLENKGPSMDVHIKKGSTIRGNDVNKCKCSPILSVQSSNSDVIPICKMIAIFPRLCSRCVGLPITNNEVTFFMLFLSFNLIWKKQTAAATIWCFHPKTVDCVAILNKLLLRRNVMKPNFLKKWTSVTFQNAMMN